MNDMIDLIMCSLHKYSRSKIYNLLMFKYAAEVLLIYLSLLYELYDNFGIENNFC